jgi:hypothetical protein
MSTPKNSDDLSGELRAAIDQLRPELPDLLGAEHHEFETELTTALRTGNETQVVHLLRRHPAAQERLVDIIRQRAGANETARALELFSLDLFGKGGSLFGKGSTILEDGTAYWCKAGQHMVAQAVVVQDLDGNLSCPTHHTPLTDLPSSFWCTTGQHSVTLAQLEQAQGEKLDQDCHPLCPTHHTPLTDQQKGGS